MSVYKIIVGIDEVGRGPLAGPVSVCAVQCERRVYERLKQDKNLPPVGKDSKKLSEKERTQYAKYLKRLAREGRIIFCITHKSNTVIDRRGIASALSSALQKSLIQVAPESRGVFVRLDGALRAPKVYAQETIIKGDEKEPLIAWASILAKVSRDALLTRLHKKYPQYGFYIHKGYGTALHRQAITTHGLSPVHRKSFCGQILLSQAKGTKRG